jgi:hypothetical protein
MGHLVSLLAATVAAIAADPGKSVEVRLEAKASGNHVGAVTVAVPWGFSHSVKDAKTLESWSADERVSLKITVMPIPLKLAPKTKEELESFLRTSTASLIAESVEGETRPFALKQAQGIGVAATYTDRSEVGKPTPKGREHYKLLTSAFVRVGDAFVICTLLSDDASKPDHQAALKAIEALRQAK